MYKTIIRPLLFLFPPEKAHHVAFTILKIVFKIPFFKSITNSIFTIEHPSLQKKIFGLTFKNPVGLAAGFDKDAVLFNELEALGFGFIEIGTVTPKAQDGNPQPRMFRLLKDSALINRMGFNNKGVDAAVEQLKNRKGNLIIGGNIGKNKVTANENAAQDYVYCFEKLYPYVDYFVVNVSSPNTPNLRELQDKEPLKALLLQIKKLNSSKSKPKPILLKIAPDLTNEQLNDIIEIVEITQIDGVVATNTTITRDHLLTEVSITNETGGLSGKPFKNRATAIVRYLHTNAKTKFPIIAVGGIFTAQDAIEKIEAGASLVQVYTGFIYEGPAMVKKINKELINYFSKK